MKTQSMFNKFESFITRAQEAINTLQVKVGKDADEQAKITIKIANLHLAANYCKAVLIKNNYTPTDAKALVAFNSVSYDTKDLEFAPVLTTLDDVYAAYITFRALLAETDGFMYRWYIKTGTVIYATLHYVNKYTFRLVWNGCVWLWDKVKGFFTKEPEAPVVNSETVTAIEATPVAEAIVEATTEASEPVAEPVVEAVAEAVAEPVADITTELDSDDEEEVDCFTVAVDPKAKWNAIAKYSNYDIEVIAKAFMDIEGDNEELFSSIFGITPEYVAKIFSAIRPVKDETGVTKTITPIPNKTTAKKAPKKGKKS